MLGLSYRLFHHKESFSETIYTQPQKLSIFFLLAFMKDNLQKNNDSSHLRFNGQSSGKCALSPKIPIFFVPFDIL